MGNGFFRRNVFWLYDYITNEGMIKRQYDNVLLGLEGKLTQEDILAFLDEELEYATSNTEYYAEYRGCSLSEFPIVNKSICIDNYESMKSKEYVGKKLHTMRTNGSTGQPFSMIQNMQKRCRVIAELKAYMYMCGLKSHQSLYYWDTLTLLKRKKRWWDCWKENIWWYDSFRFNESNIEEMICYMKKHPSKILLTFPSAIKCVGEMISDDERLKSLPLEKIILVGENVSNEVRQVAKRLFGDNVEILSRYGNQEMGVMAQQLSENGDYCLNVGSYFFEFLKLNSDKPAEVGETARIVVTDLFNRAFPLIRYDTGDLCTLRQGNDGIVFDQLIGKANDQLYDTEGYPILATSIEETLWDLNMINQWQIRQIDLKHFSVLLKMKFPQENLVKVVKDRLNAILGNSAKIDVQIVDEIPDVGYKKRFVICEVPYNQRKVKVK